jgi:hypothetical protein
MHIFLVRVIILKNLALCRGVSHFCTQGCHNQNRTVAIDIGEKSSHTEKDVSKPVFLLRSK